MKGRHEVSSATRASSNFFSFTLPLHLIFNLLNNQSVKQVNKIVTMRIPVIVSIKILL